VWTGTFHRFCSRLLRRYASLVGLQENFSIYDSSDSLRLVKQAMERSGAKDSRYRAETIANEISRGKSACLDPETYERIAQTHIQSVTAPVYQEYQQLLVDSNATDFDDLLLHVVNILKDSPELRADLDEKFRYLLVDEYQDTNLAQYAIVRGLSLDHRNLAVTGDPDQSIYSWRGANLKNILEFEKDFPDTLIVRLEDNYRSSKAILRVADQLIVNNLQRKHKSLRTGNAEGEPVRLVAFPDQQTEAQQIADQVQLWLKDNIYQADEIAIFYRANWLSRSLEHAFRSAGIPYQIVNGYEFYQRREIKDLLAYLHLLNNPSDHVALERVINVPPRKIGKVTIERLRNYAQAKRISMLESAREAGLNEEIKKGAATKISGFVALYDRLAEEKSESVERLLQVIIEETGFIDYLIAEDTPEAHERAGNVEELLLAAREFDMQHPEDGGLEAYLEQTSLVSDTDVWDKEGGSVTLMTMHAAKGLEFPVVFIVGLEEGLIPHERSSVDPDDVEEERRLLFVGITRAKQQLNLSRCLTRFRKGRAWPIIPSRFLMELPRSEMEVHEPRGYTMGDSLIDSSNDPSMIWQEHEIVQDFLQDDDEAVEAAEAAEIDAGDDVPFAIDDLIEGGEQKETQRLVAKSRSKGSAGTKGDSIREAKVDLTTKQPTPVVFSAQELISGPAVGLVVGKGVFHPTYGKGEVKGLEGSGKKQVASIEFGSVGLKTIRTAFCNLVPMP
jgi:DNA helicase-2/ATP-dependent DNA helicase PcrA